ncbi:acyl--CoA ligase [Candidatus Roizmanbacteria bacterium]|nr:acyl--CoA ligase [Candidatus Roizmanbacteria bacterium]
MLKIQFRAPGILHPEEILQEFQKKSQKTALTYVDIDGGKDYQVSYNQLAITISSGARFFSKELCLQKSDTISYIFENCPEIITLNLISFFSGFRACPLDIRRDTPEVALQKLKETKTKVCFYRKNEKFEKLISYLKKYCDIKFFAVEDFFDMKKLFKKDSHQSIFTAFDPQGISLILYTSGTTGFPKGTMLTYANLYYGALQVADWFKIGKNDIFYIVLPLHHINSTIFSLATLFVGGSLVLASRYSRTNILYNFAQYKITMSSIVPTINIDLLEEQEAFQKIKEKLKLKRIQIGSAPVSAKNTMEFYKKYKIRLIQGYGSTETALRASGVPVDLPEKLYLHLLETNSIGQPLIYNNMVLINKEGGIINKENEDGEICAQGLNIMQGYLNEPVESKKALVGGYFHTGDLGYYKIINGQKYFYHKARLKEIIIKGGVNISPLFIEEQLRKETKWARDVVVVGFSHYRFGEEIGAVFIPKNNDYQKEFQDTVKKLKENRIENLSSYETPKAAIIAQDNEIAKTATGKIQHIKVAKTFQDKLQQAYKYLGENINYGYRVITPDEETVLKDCVVVHNGAFPKGLEINLTILKHRATNGFVIGGFKKNNLVGVLTGFFANEALLRTGKNWNEISGKGLFTRGNPKGSVVVLSSAASLSSAGKTVNTKKSPKTKNLDIKKIDQYIGSNQDFVVRFHKRPKAGFQKGAHVYRIISNGNPKDRESLGIVVMFEYPSLKKLNKHQFTDNKIGLGLVEAAIRYAKEQGKEKVIALSRLGEAYKYLKKLKFKKVGGERSLE